MIRYVLFFHVLIYHLTEKRR